MSAILQKVSAEPEWVSPLLQAVDDKFKIMVSKIKSVSAMKFELDCARHLSDEEKKSVNVHAAGISGLILFPERRVTKELFEWCFPIPMKGLTFDQNLFRRHILEKAIEFSENTDCFIVFRLTLMGPNNIGITERFSIKQCENSHFED